MKKIKWWCDSGANAFSCREGVVTTKEIGITDAEWDAMTEDERESLMKEIAWDRLDWGFSEIEED